MHNCHLSTLLEMKIPGPHFRVVASESLGWVPGICIFKRAMLYLIHLSCGIHRLVSGSQDPEGCHCLLLDLLFPLLLFFFPHFSPPSIILCYWRQEGDTPTLVCATHASSYFLTKASFWNLLRFLSRSQKHPKTHQLDFRVVWEEVSAETVSDLRIAVQQGAVSFIYLGADGSFESSIEVEGLSHLRGLLEQRAPTKCLFQMLLAVNHPYQ